MIGSNKIEINQATMCEAVQYWLTNKVFAANESTPKVVKVKETSNKASSNSP